MTACPMSQTKSYQEMTPKERGTWMLSMYNSQYEDYMMTTGYTKNFQGEWEKTSSPELTESQKEVLRDKKKLLTEVYPAIKVYVGYAESGVIPDADLETMIVSKINQLIMEISN